MKSKLLILFLFGFVGCTVSSKNQGRSGAEMQEQKEQEQIDRVKREIKEVTKELKEEILTEIQQYQQATGGKDAPRLPKSQSKAKEIADQKTVIGRMEWIDLSTMGFALKARVDTGAKTCSLHAENIKEIMVDGEPHVQFDTYDEDEKKYTLIRKIVTTSIVTNTSGIASKRYVIRERIQLGNQVNEVNVNLNNRKNLRSNFLIGRNYLMGRYIVDVSLSHVMGHK